MRWCCRVADNQHLHVRVGVLADRSTLNGKDLGILGEQVLALHARAARTGAHQQGDVCVLEGDVRIVGGDHSCEQRKAQSSSSIITPLTAFCACGRSSNWRITGWSLAEHFAAGNAEQQTVADLAGSAGDGNATGALPLLMVLPSQKAVA